MRVRFAALLAILVATAALAEHRPTLFLDRDRVLVALPDSILKEAEVRKRLASALTTTFLLKARVRGATEQGAARLEIRYDLWNEDYQVRRVEANGHATAQTVAAAQLQAWWRTPVFLTTVSAPRSTIDLELIVLPFSAAEEQDARQWLSKSGGAGRPDTPADGIVDALIGTTLNARPIVSYRWSAEVVRP